MNIERANHWMSLVANLAVLFGIAFLAYELQQNTKNERIVRQPLSLLVADERLESPDYLRPLFVAVRDISKAHFWNGGFL